MRPKRVIAASAAALLTGLAGCFFAADLVSPSLLSSLGFDPENLAGPAGKVVVSFNNQSDFPAVFFFAETTESVLPPSQWQDGFSTVGPGEVASSVLACPLGAVVPGTFDDQTIAVVVDEDGTAVDVPYEGAPLRSGVEFVCGDVIEVRLVQAGDGGEEGEVAYALFVRVIPGR